MPAPDFDAKNSSAAMAMLRQSPKDVGTVEQIVVRPAVGQRSRLDRAELTPADGVVGDRWGLESSHSVGDGAPNPAVQVTLMNARCIELLAGDRENWAAAGDNLFVDFDLSQENLAVGTRLAVGSCILEITQPPHTGCVKFKSRFGPAAIQLVNSPDGKLLRLRGVHARVVQAGVIEVGDRIEKLAIDQAGKSG